MRICSFLPSATEILYLLGLDESVVGVTHECDYPSDAKNKKVVVRSTFDASSLESGEIDRIVSSKVKAGEDIYAIEEEALRSANPDLIVAQGLCEVCSPHEKEVERAVKVLGRKPEIVILDPHNLDDILVNIGQIAKATGKIREGESAVRLLRERIEYVKSTVSGVDYKPRALCIEWMDPLFSAGHWVPEMMEMSGAVNGISKAGEPSRRMSWEEVIEFDPELIFLMPCGFDIDRTRKEMKALESRAEWKSLKAVRNKKVYATDANSYFSRPGPRIVTGIEVLAKVLHPERFSELSVPEKSYLKVY